jgi:ammonia channel protein AmtB
MFAYCSNNPVLRNDQSGEFWGIATLTAAAIGGLLSAVSDVAVQIVTTGTVDIGQTAITAVSGAISGACALIPGNKVVTTLVSGAINAGLGVLSYCTNQIRKEKDISLGDAFAYAGIGFVSGVAGNLFRINSTGAMRDAGENLIEKGIRKMFNGVANSATSTINRGFQYIDRGIKVIYDYAKMAGTNSGVGSYLGNALSGLYSG